MKIRNPNLRFNAGAGGGSIDKKTGELSERVAKARGISKKRGRKIVKAKKRGPKPPKS